MKTFIILILVFVSSFSFAQFYEDWTEPFAITDSMSINTKPDLMADTDILNGDVIVFYEKKMDATSNTQIWMRNLTTLEDEQEILAAEDIDFRNPKLLVFSPYSYTRCFIIYESNELGNYNIYGIEFFEDGSFGPTFQLTDTDENEESCYVNWVDVYLSACWEVNGDIFFSEIFFSQDTLIFDDVETIDTNNCLEPVCSGHMVSWRKLDGDSAKIYYSDYIIGDEWTEPYELYNSGHNINLQMVDNMFYGLSEDYIIWENNGEMFNWDHWTLEVSPIQFQGVESYYEPSMLLYGLITKNPIETAIYTFCSGEFENREVYAVNPINSFEAFNISNNTYVDSYPKLFMGKWASNYFNTISVWQSEVNDYSVLYTSQVSVLIGGTNELETKNNLILQIGPNPFKNQLDIEFSSINSGILGLEIVDLTGNTIFKKQFDLIANDRKSFKWNPNIIDKRVSDGIYFVKLTQGNSSLVKKVVYSK